MPRGTDYSCIKNTIILSLFGGGGGGGNGTRGGEGGGGGGVHNAPGIEPEQTPKEAVFRD